MGPDPPRDRYLLVVEDDLATREALLLALRAEGYPAAGAANGQEAFDYLSRHPAPRLILLDLMMPVMDGWEFRQRQRLIPTLESVPVVVLSADNNLDRKAATLGAIAYFQKPIDFDELTETLQRLMDRPASQQVRGS